MQEQIITHKTALLAKEKGITSGTFGNIGYYDDIGNGYGVFCSFKHLNSDSPAYVTQSLLQKWLREECGICCYIDWQEMNLIICTLYKGSHPVVSILNKWSIIGKNPLEEKEKGLYESLKLIK